MLEEVAGMPPNALPPGLIIEVPIYGRAPDVDNQSSLQRTQIGITVTLVFLAGSTLAMSLIGRLRDLSYADREA